MRLVLVGGTSFIAQHIQRLAREALIEVVSLRHFEDPKATVTEHDVVVNLAIHPEYRTGPYRRSLDFDLSAAHCAARAGARFVMLSTRRVYGDGNRWNALETNKAEGDDTPYGRNKARSERDVLEMTQGRGLILRLSNVFGWEYVATTPRRSFFGLLLGTLKREGAIYFDMHLDTRRDFIPVDASARALLSAIQAGLQGVYNLGAGFPVRCGDIAEWVCEGYGGGRIVVDPPIVRDEFFLNINRWKEHLPAPIDRETMRDFCVQLGQTTRCAEF